MAEHGFNNKSSTAQCFLWGSLLCWNSLQPAGKREAGGEETENNSRFLCDSQIDTGLSKHYLLLSLRWSITCHSAVLLFLTSSPVCGCDRVAADHSPSSQLSGRRRAVCCKLNHVNHVFDGWEIHTSSLYLCIQAALCCSHFQWQEFGTKEKFCTI